MSQIPDLNDSCNVRDLTFKMSPQILHVVGLIRIQILFPVMKRSVLKEKTYCRDFRERAPLHGFKLGHIL